MPIVTQIDTERWWGGTNEMYDKETTDRQTGRQARRQTDKQTKTIRETVP